MPREESQPFATATMARIYLEQGKLDAAERILQQVLAQQPGDPQALAGLAEVARRRTTPEAASGEDSERVHLERRGDGLACRYRVSAQARTRAELVLGEEGALVLRVVGFPARADAAPVDVPLRQIEGELAVSAPPGADLALAAVGALGEDGRFVAIAHSGMVPVHDRD